MVDIIHRGAPHAGVVPGEAHRLDEVDRDAHAGPSRSTAPTLPAISGSNRAIRMSADLCAHPEPFLLVEGHGGEAGLGLDRAKAALELGIGLSAALPSGLIFRKRARLTTANRGRRLSSSRSSSVAALRLPPVPPDLGPRSCDIGPVEARTGARFCSLAARSSAGRAMATPASTLGSSALVARSAALISSQRWWPPVGSSPKMCGGDAPSCRKCRPVPDRA
jgi:hypothetical protein